MLLGLCLFVLLCLLVIFFATFSRQKRLTMPEHDRNPILVKSQTRINGCNCTKRGY